MTSTAQAFSEFELRASGRSEEGSAVCGAAMSRVTRMAEKVAPTTISVLILGECGVGKDVLARSIHQRSRRADKRFLAINCGAIPETLIASELFGYEPGAFTGAVRTGKMGLLEAADGGTVFLDEIGDLPLPTQATLLRVLETGELRPVMALRPRFVDVRFIAATNKNLTAAVARGEFRQDLLHRLNTLTLSVPPLRERVDEIPALAQQFVEAACRKMGKARPPRLGPALLAQLVRQRWPGNIRELKNVMECAVALSDGTEIRIDDLPILDAPTALGPRMDEPGDEPPSGGLDLADRESRRDILAALAACSGNQTRAAAMLGISRRTFIARLDRYQVPRPQKDYASKAAKRCTRRDDAGSSSVPLSPGQMSPGQNLQPMGEREMAMSSTHRVTLPAVG